MLDGWGLEGRWVYMFKGFLYQVSGRGGAERSWLEVEEASGVHSIMM